MLDGLGERGHRHAGRDERRRGGHRPLDCGDRAAHRLELVGGLDPAEPFTSREPVRRRSVPRIRARLSVVSAQIRSPTASTPEPAAVRATRSKTAKPVVGLVYDQNVAVRGLAEVERREHARQHERGLCAGPKESPRDPSVRVQRLPEARHGPLDPREVLEIGRGAEEERCDAFGFEAFVETAPPGGVVEHRASLRRHRHCPSRGAGSAFRVAMRSEVTLGDRRPVMLTRRLFVVAYKLAHGGDRCGLAVDDEPCRRAE